MTGSEERAQLEEQVERSEQDLRAAVEDLKDAVSRPFRVVEQLAENPTPWLLAGVLVGVWLGARNGDSH